MQILQQQIPNFLSNNLTIPALGLGVLKAKDGHEVQQAVNAALTSGYRLIDTASVYGNEQGVGQAIAESSIDREDIFLTTKVWNRDQGYDQTLHAFEQSLQRLGTDYVDLYLVHWPVKGKYKDTWRALERIHQDGRAKAIGVRRISSKRQGLSRWSIKWSCIRICSSQNFGRMPNRTIFYWRPGGRS